MPDYIYLLENRLTADQQHALRVLREVAREAGTILFLTGSPVRDLTNGSPVRDLEIVVHENALKLKKTLEKRGASVWGEDEASKTLYLCFPGTVRVDLVSAHRTEYPKSGKPVFHKASIQEYLRCRDFTANSMAISLNEGSFGLLMDPLNGVADIESRILRLVSAYGFLEEPAFLISATRYLARLGWEFDDKTRTRYANALEEGVIANLSPFKTGWELEQIAHEEDGLKILRALEEAGWMKALFPAWTAAKADEARLTALHELAVRFELQGVRADLSAARMQLLTAKLNPKDRTTLQKLLPRPGFVAEWNSLDTIAAGFAKVLQAKDKQIPSAGYKLFMSYDPEAILWLGFTNKTAAIRDHYEKFLSVWPESRQRIPYVLMQEMRIVPDLAIYKEVIESTFLALIDGKLTTPEEMRAFLEPHSPPAPPPPVTIKRTRVKRNAARVKDEEEDDDRIVPRDRDEDEDDLDDLGTDDDLDVPMPLGARHEDEDADEEEDHPDERPIGHESKSKSGKVIPINAKPSKAEALQKSAKPVAGPAKPVLVPKPAIPAKAVAAKTAPKSLQKVPEPLLKAPAAVKKQAAQKPVAAAKAVLVKKMIAAAAKKPTSAPVKGKPALAKPVLKKKPVSKPGAKTVSKKPAPQSAKPMAPSVKGKISSKKPVAKKPVLKPAAKAVSKKPVAASLKGKAVPKKAVQKKLIAKKPAPKPRAVSKKPVAVSAKKIKAGTKKPVSKPIAKKPVAKAKSGKKR